MVGAIIGDVIGSRFEWQNSKSKDFTLFTNQSRFTDDTVMTIAVAKTILDSSDYASTLRSLGRKYPFAGYGGNFKQWITGQLEGPYNSWGNGSAMRVSPVGFAFEEEGQVLLEAERSAAITHNHPEGIKGAQAVALAILLARKGHSKTVIKSRIEQDFGYNLSRTLDEIRPNYSFDVSCQGSVPEAVIAFLESENFEDAIRGAISIGGDSDTIACIAGSIAEAFYQNIPSTLIEETRSRLTPDLLEVVDAFYEKYMS